jgi:hypothetical protein
MAGLFLSRALAFPRAVLDVERMVFDVDDVLGAALIRDSLPELLTTSHSTAASKASVLRPGFLHVQFQRQLPVLALADGMLVVRGALDAGPRCEASFTRPVT